MQIKRTSEYLDNNLQRCRGYHNKHCNNIPGTTHTLLCSACHQVVVECLRQGCKWCESQHILTSNPFGNQNQMQYLPPFQQMQFAQIPYWSPYLNTNLANYQQGGTVNQKENEIQTLKRSHEKSLQEFRAEINVLVKENDLLKKENNGIKKILEATEKKFTTLQEKYVLLDQRKDEDLELKNENGNLNDIVNELQEECDDLIEKNRKLKKTVRRQKNIIKEEKEKAKEKKKEGKLVLKELQDLKESRKENSSSIALKTVLTSINQ